MLLKDKPNLFLDRNMTLIHNHPCDDARVSFFFFNQYLVTQVLIPWKDST